FNEVAFVFVCVCRICTHALKSSKQSNMPLRPQDCMISADLRMRKAVAPYQLGCYIVELRSARRNLYRRLNECRAKNESATILLSGSGSDGGRANRVWTRRLHSKQCRCRGY